MKNFLEKQKDIFEQQLKVSLNAKAPDFIQELFI
jgi:hypothetical protein